MFASGKAAAVSSDANYIEDVFSTYLYGTSATSVPNGIDISGKGALIWLKSRANDAGNMNNALFDSARGFSNILYSNTTGAQIGPSGVIASTSNNGFTLGGFNDGSSYASWTFRKQPKFFDVVTWSGNNTAGREIPHSLGSVPGFIVVKCTTNASTAWSIYHRSLGATKYLEFDDGAVATAAGYWNNTEPTSTVFTLGNDGNVNATGRSYVAYLFASNAGGFGLTGTDNVISCGSFTQASGGTTVNLGYEPQWVMVRSASAASNWFIFDNMRGNTATLYPNLSNAEVDQGAGSFQYNSTGFTMADYISGAVGNTMIYIAIRRGPMKVPTSGTSVFEPAIYTGNGTNPRTIGSLQATDLAINMSRNTAGDVPAWVDRLRGSENYIYSSGTGAEAGGLTGWKLEQTGQIINGIRNTSPKLYVDYLIKRAPSFMDVVCYTGTGSSVAQNHNLGVTPELLIFKTRSAVDDWEVVCRKDNGDYVYGSTISANGFGLNRTNGISSTTTPANLGLTSTTFLTLGLYNTNAVTYVAYLFATCAGVSKVGSYTGTGTTLQVNCGFTGGARFVLIKRTDSTGSWYVWDVARGISSGNDPYLLLNSTAAEVTNTDYIDAYSAGFEISSTAPSEINASGGSFIFLAIS